MLAIEIWEPAVKTYDRNHPRSTMIDGDIRTVAVRDRIRALHRDKPIDIGVGGFPCQGFSMAGNRDPQDKRSQLYQDYLEAVAELKPVIFVMENVKSVIGLASKTDPPCHRDRELSTPRFFVV